MTAEQVYVLTVDGVRFEDLPDKPTAEELRKPASRADKVDTAPTHKKATKSQDSANASSSSNFDPFSSDGGFSSDPFATTKQVPKTKPQSTAASSGFDSDPFASTKPVAKVKQQSGSTATPDLFDLPPEPPKGTIDLLSTPSSSTTAVDLFGSAPFGASKPAVNPFSTAPTKNVFDPFSTSAPTPAPAPAFDPFSTSLNNTSFISPDKARMPATAQDLSKDFAGLSFSSPIAPASAPVAAPPAVFSPPPAPAAPSIEQKWGAGSLVDLDNLGGKANTKVTPKAMPSLSQMTSPPSSYNQPMKPTSGQMPPVMASTAMAPQAITYGQGLGQRQGIGAVPPGAGFGVGQQQPNVLGTGMGMGQQQPMQMGASFGMLPGTGLSGSSRMMMGGPGNQQMYGASSATSKGGNSLDTLNWKG